MDVVEQERITRVDFTEFVAARGAALQRFAYLVTGGRDDAPDLVQDALGRAYPRWADLARRGTAEAYVRRAIVNGSVSGWRKHRRLVVVEDAEPHVRDRVDDPAEVVSDADHAWSLVSSLPPAQRAAVVLRFYEDLTFEQIALILDIPAATARSHVHRALKTLRITLGEENPDD